MPSTSRAGGDARRVAAGFMVLAVLSAAVGIWAWNRPVSPVTLARSAYARGEWKEAAKLARDHLKGAPDDRDALRLLARSMGRTQEAGAAAIYWRLGGEGAEPEDYFLLASTLLRQREEGQAMVFLERARSADPDHAETLDALVKLYTAKAYPTAAAEAAQRLSKLPGWEARGSWALGPMLIRRHDGPGASEAFREVLRRDPTGELVGAEPAKVRKLLARALLMEGKPDEARETLGAIQGADSEAAWLSSRAWMQSGNAVEAAAPAKLAGDYGRDDPSIVEPSPFVGDARCVNCHVDLHRSQVAGRHATTFARGGVTAGLPLPPDSIADPRIAGAQHTLRREGDAVRVEARVSDANYSALVEYVLGTGHRGRTAIVRDEKGLPRESRLTHYGDGVGWDLTVHHPERPDSASGLLGKPMLEDQVEDCLRCHVTDVRSVREKTGPVADDRGIRCERCHGPGGNHLKAVALALPDKAIGHAQISTAERRGAMCAECHKAPVGATETNRDFVRFQSPNLAKSRCFTDSGGRLDCTTCHDPHRDAETSGAFYEAICLECHAAKDKESAAVESSSDRSRLICPVNKKSGCVGCHMPTVPETIPHTSYTDHHIRVHRDDSGQKGNGR
jgi:tetratricopeptide (TPR) repeat protein